MAIAVTDRDAMHIAHTLSQVTDGNPLLARWIQDESLFVLR